MYDKVTLLTHSINRKLFGLNELNKFYTDFKRKKKNVGFLYSLLYFLKGKNVKHCEKLCKAYGHDALTTRQCQRWFAKFYSGDSDVNDAPRPGKPIKADDDEIKAMVMCSPQARDCKGFTHCSINRL